MISTAYLRVYVYADGAEDMPRAESVAGADPIKSDGRFIWNESLREDAFSTTWNGIEYVCPRNTRLRMVEGVLAFSATHPRIPLIDDHERESFKSELADRFEVEPCATEDRQEQHDRVGARCLSDGEHGAEDHPQRDVEHRHQRQDQRNESH